MFQPMRTAKQTDKSVQFSLADVLICETVKQTS